MPDAPYNLVEFPFSGGDDLLRIAILPAVNGGFGGRLEAPP